ncbi:rhogap domain containing protein, partial [Entamoeba invadens IP1]
MESTVCEVFQDTYTKWKPQFIELDVADQMLRIYQDERRLKMTLQLSLTQSIFVKLLNNRTVEDKKISFGIILIDKKNHSFVRIAFPTSTSHRRLYIPIAKVCDCYGCFGVPLEIAVAYGKWKIPLPMYRAIQYLLMSDNIETDGLFRISAAGSLLIQARNSMEKGKDIEPSEFSDANVAAGIIKLYLRSLPDSLIPSRMTDKFIEIVKMDEKFQLEQFKSFVTEIPEPNGFIFKYLMFFLTKVVEKSDINKMVAGNIAIVFAPNLLFYEDNEDGLMLSKNVNDLIARCVENYSEVFGTVEEFPGKFPPFDREMIMVDHEEFILKRKVITRKSVLPDFA